MDNDNQNQIKATPTRRYIWPWFVLAALILAIALAILWVSKEVQRTRRQRDFNSTGSNSSVETRCAWLSETPSAQAYEARPSS
jgi:hypothetical protein